MDTILERIRRAPSLLDVFGLADELSEAAATLPARAGAVAPAALVEAIGDPTDVATGIAAIHALVRLPPGVHDERLAEVVAGGGPLATHAAWALAERDPAGSLVPGLVRSVETGRLAGMLAQRTLVRWSGRTPTPIVRELTDRLSATSAPGPRSRLIETLGLADRDEGRLVAIAADGDEAADVRAAAIAALGDRAGSLPATLSAIAAGDDPIADTARLALADRGSLDARVAAPDAGLRVTQVHLGGRLDRGLQHAGEGDTGGIATLLIQLGDALVADPRVSAVTTVGRGSAAEAVAALEDVGPRHAVLPAPLGRHQDAGFAGAWPALVAAERGLRRALRHRPATLLHLRMADVGSLAAARIARRRGLPIVFTLAPDPHAVIAEMERTGELDRSSFGPADEREALWFRAWVVRHLTAAARQVVLFPRTSLAARLRDLLGIDIAADPARYHVIPEGIDPEPVRAASRMVAQGASVPPAVATALRTRVAALGPGRAGLPLVVSVGRLTELKGMARLVEAFAADADLRRRANLVIVGGDLQDPTPEERAELDRIEAARAACPEVVDALVMLGHQPHDEVLRVLAIAEAGLEPSIAPGGAYACGSRKEEFGLAIVEALAVGLPVVAPRAGGPASYLEPGVTGQLVDTMDSAALAAGIAAALDLAASPGRAERARALVAERFTIRAMSDALAPVYDAAVSTAGDPLPVTA